MKKSWLWLTSLMLVLSVFLVACSGGNGATTEKKDEGKKEGEETTATGPQAGGTLVYALDSAPEGLFNWNFYGIATDAEVLGMFDSSLLEVDENLEYKPGIASWETPDNKVYTFTFEKGVKWHNGEELTVHDWVFSLETLAHPDYDGPRYTNVQTVVGAPEFKEGKADTISGIKVIDDYTIEITFDEARVNNLENLWTYPMSKKAFEGIAVKDMSASEVVRTKPVGLGPFKVNKIVPGESIELVRNDDYWKGKPYLDKIVMKVIDSSLTVGELQNGSVDMTAFHPSIINEVEAIENVEVVKYPGLAYYYVGFKLGHWDGSKNVMDKPKYQDIALRQAMYHAIDRESWVEAFFFGVGKPVNRPVPTSHWIAAPDSELNAFEYDPEKAKSLLADAGYKDTNGDGFVEDPNGKELVVKFAHYATSNPTFEARAKALTQYWEEIGLKTELAMTEVNLYYDGLEKDEPSIEVFFGGWGTGTDPDPSGLWKSDALWNYPRWVSETSDQLLADALNVEVVGTDKEKRKQLYIDWQKHFMDELPILPIAELGEVVALSSRLKGVTYDVSGSNDPNEWYIEE